MANFVGYRENLADETETLVYDAGSSGGLLMSAVATNVAEHDVRISLYVRTDESTPRDIYLVKEVSIPTKASLGVLAGKVALNEGDKLYAFSSAEDSDPGLVDVYVSTLES